MNKENLSALTTQGVTIPWAGLYDKLVNLVSWGKAEVLRSEINQKAPYKLGDKVLDVGCGTGDQAILAKTAVGKEGAVHGLDASPKMIAVAKAKADQLDVSVNFQVGLVESIAHPDETFDVVMSSLVMHHLPGELKQKAIAEFLRVLKPGGQIYIVDMESSSTGTLKQRLTDLMVHLHGGRKGLENNVRKLIPLFEAGGFKGVEWGRVNRQFASLTGT